MLNLQASFAAIMGQSVVHARNLVDTRLIVNSSATASMHLLEITSLDLHERENTI